LKTCEPQIVTILLALLFDASCRLGQHPQWAVCVHRRDRH
jgi:hypothetical protein